MWSQKYTFFHFEAHWPSRVTARELSMKLSTTLDYSGGFLESVKKVKALESAGLDLVWVAEAYGFDAVSLMGFLAGQTEHIEIASGILPIYSRTPALLAMTAAGVDALSEGRCVLGL